MTQSRRASLLESAANIAIGYGVAVAAQGVIGGLFTAVSLVRSYCLRRLFNKLSTGRRQ